MTIHFHCVLYRCAIWSCTSFFCLVANRSSVTLEFLFHLLYYYCFRNMKYTSTSRHRSHKIYASILMFEAFCERGWITQRRRTNSKFLGLVSKNSRSLTYPVWTKIPIFKIKRQKIKTIDLSRQHNLFLLWLDRISIDFHVLFHVYLIRWPLFECNFSVSHHLCSFTNFLKFLQWQKAMLIFVEKLY